MLSPAHVPLPASPSISTTTNVSRRSSLSSQPFHPSPLSSPLTTFRPRLDRAETSATIRGGGGLGASGDLGGEDDPFKEGATISVNQPVGSISISPSSRDVCLASRKGLYILDLANLNNAPRFVPQGGTWQIADVQWSPHPVTSHLILSTSSQKLLVWDLAAQRPLLKSLDAHSRAITDINWHAINPNLMATVAMDAGIRGWDMRCWDRPVMRLCAWGAAGTQVKWNRRHEHLVATAHGKIVHVWDDRKGSVPVTTIKAHDAKIYGIDWDRQRRHKLVTCSLDKTIKYWTVPELGGSPDASTDYHPCVPAPSEPTYTISTTYPVWRARNLPFGKGVLSLPQRGEKALEMFAAGDDDPVERFAGHDDVVKDFVWRTRGGEDGGFDDREFQLVTWSKDRTLRIWPVAREVTERVGFNYGAPIKVLVSRRGAPDVTYTKDPAHKDKDAPKLPPPVVNTHPNAHPTGSTGVPTHPNPSNLTRQKHAKPEVQPGMTRGGNTHRHKGMDQLDWLTKVVKNAPSPESSGLQSRMGSLSRTRGPGSRAGSVEGRQEWVSLKDEVVQVSRMYPRPKINFEKIDLAHRKLTISMQGPWANGDRAAFMRIHWSFPPNYPYGPEMPTFELERNPTVSAITRQSIVMTIKEMRAHNKQCLVPTTGYLLGIHERQGRRRGVGMDDSDSESERGDTSVRRQEDNVPEAMLSRPCGATFGPNGQLVCFFPKQTALPRTRNISRSPSITRDNPTPMIKALSALTRLQHPNRQNAVRYKPRLRRLEPLSMPAPAAPAGSTMTIHDVSYLGSPSATLARVYGMSVEGNMGYALEAKRLDHAEVWATMRGVLADPPPVYSVLPELVGQEDPRRERVDWERGMARKKKVLDQLFAVLIAARDFQMLALVSVILLEYTKTAVVPAQPDSWVNRSPVMDYFTLPRVTPHYPTPPPLITPTRHRTNSGVIPLSPSNSSSFRGSGWSQILNPSGISLRGALTPKDRTSFGDLPFARTVLGTSYEDQSPTGLAIPSGKRLDSPKIARAEKERGSNEKERKFPMASIPASVSPPYATPLKPSGTDKSLGSSGDPRSHKVSFGSASPLGRGSRPGTAGSIAGGGERGASGGASGFVGVGGGGTGSAITSGVNTPAGEPQTPGAGRRRVRTCTVRLDFPRDQTPTPSLLPPELLPLCEAWKLAYADFLLRAGLLGIRTTLMGFEFIPHPEKRLASIAASGEAAGIVKMDQDEEMRKEAWRSGGDDMEIRDLRMDELRAEKRNHLTVCVPCSSSPPASCPSCTQRPVRPTCSFCRVPIKGLSMGCSICAHKLHAKCFQRYFLSAEATPMTCPACSCSCLAHKGISTPFFVVPAAPRQSPSVTRGFARSKMPDSAGHREPEKSGRVTYASLVKLGTIRENLGLGGAAPADGGNQQSWGMSRDASALGLNAGGDDDVPMDRERTLRGEQRAGGGGDGLLSRARWGGEGLLHWKGRDASQG
ncbi:hypothetical protein IAT38_006173 [Cryptococcus sp. DSM 104549]